MLSCRQTLAGQRGVCVALAGRKLWLGFDPSTRRPRHDGRKHDEIVKGLRSELSAFIRIWYYFSYVYQYSSTAVREHEMMANIRWKRDTVLC